MNSIIVGSVIRWALGIISGTAIGAALMASGAFDQETINALISRVTDFAASATALGVLVWSIYQKIKAARALRAAIVAPARPL